jgi:hypothetical protein
MQAIAQTARPTVEPPIQVGHEANPIDTAAILKREKNSSPADAGLFDLA